MPPLQTPDRRDPQQERQHRLPRPWTGASARARPATCSRIRIAHGRRRGAPRGLNRGCAHAGVAPPPAGNEKAITKLCPHCPHRARARPRAKSRRPASRRRRRAHKHVGSSPWAAGTRSRNPAVRPAGQGGRERGYVLEIPRAAWLVDERVELEADQSFRADDAAVAKRGPELPCSRQQTARNGAARAEEVDALVATGNGDQGLAPVNAFRDRYNHHCCRQELRFMSPLDARRAQAMRKAA